MSKLTAILFLFWAASAADAPSISLIDIAARARLNFRHASSPTSQKYLIESMSGGVAAFDYNNDGRLDLFFVNGAQIDDPMPAGKSPSKSREAFWNRLYKNNGDGTFTDVTVKAGLQGTGYGMGVASADFDNDGFADLYVTALGRNALYHNNGDGTFKDVTTEAGVGGSGWSTGALFIDYDRDGLLDLIVTRYVEWDFTINIWCGERKPGYRAYCHPDQFQPTTYLVFHNEGGGKFRDVSAQSGLAKYKGKGLGLAMNDFDGDGWPDVFVANDAVPQQLFRNQGNGTFEEVAVARGVAYDADGHSFSGMGADFADYDNDGWPDIFANALATQRYALFRNLKGTFDYVSSPSGVGAASAMHSGWGAKFVDLDNDGWKDLFVGQGHVMDNIQLSLPQVRYLESPLVMRNTGTAFRTVGTPDGPVYAARGVAIGDFNNDGKIDVVMNCNNGPAVLLENRTPASSNSHWLVVDTVGKTSNRDGIGTLIRVTTATQVQSALVTTGGSYLSSSDKRAHFGLGANREARLIELTWPSGKTQRVEHVAGDQIVSIKEP